jgi:hypothetical protein
MKLLIVLTIGFFTQLALAEQPMMEVSGPVLTAGDGCPQGSATIVFSSDSSTFSVIYDRLSVQADAPGMARTKCTVTFPFRLRNGFRARIQQVDTRGFVSLQAGDSASLKTKFHWQGGLICLRVCLPSIPVEMVRNYSGPIQKDFTEGMDARKAFESSGCGGSRGTENMRLEVTNELTVNNNSAGDSALVVDTQDGTFRSVTKYRVTFERCIR